MVWLKCEKCDWVSLADDTSSGMLSACPACRTSQSLRPLPEQPEEAASGKKYDTGKPPLSMLTKESLIAEARAFEYGAKKYGRNNYKKGMEWTRMVDAALRHITAWNSGENLDPESGLSHLWHAKASLAMLIYYEDKNIGIDDRDPFHNDSEQTNIEPEPKQGI